MTTDCQTTPDDIYSTYINGVDDMTAAAATLLVKFRAKDTQFGVTRSTVKALAKELDVNETQVIHMALSKFALDVLPAYELDDGPLTAKQIAALKKDVEKHFPKGKLISSEALFT
jgi:allophanate hydrolase subunit 1